MDIKPEKEIWTMRIAVCEGNEAELAHLSEVMAGYQSGRGANVRCSFFRSSTDFLCDVRGGEYDLVLMDAVMQGVSGIQAARELRELDKNVKIIFMSSSPEYAVESYSVEAWHYLLKPIDDMFLLELLDRAGRELEEEDRRGFVLKNREGIVRILFSSLEYVEVINKTVAFHLTDGVAYEVTAALTDFEEKLLIRREFFKSHRSYIVNLNYIRAVQGDHVITTNGNSIPVSRQRRGRMRDACLNFLPEDGARLPEPEVQGSPSDKQRRADGFWRILIVDDDPAECAFWSGVLKEHGCAVEMAGDGEKALRLAADVDFDCILLDVMIPGEDGFSICERLHRISRVPVIFLSSLTETDKQLKGFAAGGIDYIAKDTPAELFWAKVETGINIATSGRTKVCYGRLVLDLKERKVFVGDKELSLSPVEFDILRKISEHTGHTFTLEEISDMVFGTPLRDDGKMVQSHMSRLRRKLEKADAGHRFIETAWGEGYRFVP